MPSVFRKDNKTCSIQTESAPPETAQITVSPGCVMHCPRIHERILSLMLPFQIGERKELRPPLQLDRPGLAVTVFRNNALGNVLVLRVGIVIFVSVEEHDGVRILLDSAGFAKIGQHRPLVGTRFVGTGQLAKTDDRHIQLLCHDLERTGDVTDDRYAVVAGFAGRGCGHQLQIVDQHQPQIVEPAAFRVDLRDRDGRIVVHADIRLAERGRGDRELSPVFLIQMTGRKLLVFNKAFRGKKTHVQLFARHFERKERDSLFIGLRHIQADIERDGRLAHAGTGGDQNQVGLVQAVDLAVKIVKSGRFEGLPVVIFSSLVNDEMKRKGEALGVDAQLSKPEIGRLVHQLDLLLK